MKYDILLLMSGGSDSILLLEMARSLGKSVYPLLIDYEQVHKEELEVAKKYLTEKTNIGYYQVNVSGLNINSALTGDRSKGQYEGVSIYNVPGRNTIFLSLALSFAEANDIDEIWYGADMSDYYGKFPDCYQSYVAKVNELFEIAGSKKIKVNAPLLGYTKEMVLEVLEKLYKIKKEDIYSGYGEFA